MRKTEIIFKRNTNFMLHGYVWKPECKPVGVIQVIHGMTEYIVRYEEFAAHFTDLGYVVCGYISLFIIRTVDYIFIVGMILSRMLR